jgi:hypothetical protein
MSGRRKKMVIDLFAGQGAASGCLIREMVPTKSLTVTVLRGRITPEEAWFRLELSGAASAIARFVTRSREGIAILPPSAGAFA